MSYSEQQKYSEAIKYHLKAISIIKEIYGDINIHGAKSYNNLALTY